MDIGQKKASVPTPHACSSVVTEHAIGETPDLFTGLASSNDQPVRASGASGASSVSARNSKPTKQAVAPAGRKNIAQIDHLAAARKLQWQLRRARSHSPEEVKTGRLICRHLLALLNEAAQNDALDQKSA